MKYLRYFKRRTKIVCTIGPATESTAMIERLIKAGMNVARLNLSHGEHQKHAQSIKIIRNISQRFGISVAILIDLPGPKYRTGKIKGGQVELRKGTNVVLTTRMIEGDATAVSVNIPNLPHDVKVGNTVLVDDGAIQLRVLKKEASEVICRVIIGGVLTEGRGLVVPGMHTSGPYITDTLKKHILFAITHNPDFIALSFVNNDNEITEVRKILVEHKASIPIIAKIERGEAVKKFDRIVTVSDGIMVARGDLGVDIPLEKVPLIQKELIKKCNQVNKPVITATQMLESMVTAARPTRAEVTDVANAVFDGSDATMLSAETSVGKYPVQAVAFMDKIIQETENKLAYGQLLAERGKWLEQTTEELISYSACHTAQSLGARAIVALTQSGSTAKRVSKYHPHAPILALTSNARILGRLLLYWGVYPFQIPHIKTVDELFKIGTKLAKEKGIAKQGEFILITGGVPMGVAGSTNLLKVERVS
ncbi:MAG: pyruvate kinase [Thermodesulfobacteriota bacterium]|nr:pyruvate kinase [Thermodesulfobacteriota bacterium]